MPQPGTQVDPHLMMTAAGQVDAAAQIVDGLRLKIEGYHTDLATGWKSTASMSYQQVAADFDARMRIIRSNLNDIHVGLGQGGLNYHTNDQDVQAAANKIQQLINQ